MVLLISRVTGEEFGVFRRVQPFRPFSVFVFLVYVIVHFGRVYDTEHFGI